MRRSRWTQEFAAAGWVEHCSTRPRTSRRSRGQDRLRVGIRLPLRDVQEFWTRRGFHRAAVHDYWRELARRVGVEHVLATPEDTEALGGRLAGVLRAGDLVVLSGALGTGKTTLVRGLGVGLGCAAR